MALEETLKVPSAVFQAVAVVVTAYFASKSLNAWRRQSLGKRKMARQTERWEGDIWGTGDEKDEIANRVKIAMGEIEELCRSHLKDDR